MFSVQRLVFMFALFASIQKMVATDARCFLENGSSAEMFFISEDFPVGEVIGTLPIIGDPTENGNITLRLLGQDLPVSIVDKNITLTRRLDKENVNGPSSVNINVSCDRINATDPTIAIPVTIRVTDANDNAPQFVNKLFVLNISEATPVGTPVLQGVKAVDADQPGPFSTVHYSVAPGPYSHYFAFPNSLEGTLLLQKPLDYEVLNEFSITIRAEDQGSPPQHSNASVHVYVSDADDQNPQFQDSRYTAVLPETPVRGAALRVQPRAIAAFDRDQALNATLLYSFDAAGSADHPLFEVHAASGRVALWRDVGAEELLVPTTLVLRAAQADNPDRYALTTLTVERAAQHPGKTSGETMEGASTALASAVPAVPPPTPPRFLQRVFSTRVLDPLVPGLRVLAALTNRPHDPRLSFWLGDEADARAFAVSSTGEIALLQPLINRTEELLSFTVHVGDGVDEDSARVEVEVPAANAPQPRFRSAKYEFQVSGPVRGGAPVGRVEAWGGEPGDAVHFALRGPDADLFAIDLAGVLRLAGDAEVARGRDAHLEVVATASGRPTRWAAVPVVVRFAKGLPVHAPALTPAPASHAPPAANLPAGSAVAPLEVLFAMLGAIMGAGALVVLLLLYLRRLKRHKGRGVVNEGSGGACNPKLYAGAGDDAAISEAAYRAMAYTATIKPRARPGARWSREATSERGKDEAQLSAVECLESGAACADTSVKVSPVPEVTMAVVETR